MERTYLSQSTCERLDPIRIICLWNYRDDARKIHLVRWDLVCKPKRRGLLAIRQARIVLLSKVGWESPTE